MRHTLPLEDLNQSGTFQVASPTPQSACLVKIYPAVVSGSLIPLHHHEYVFGRDAECQYELPDEFVSRRHAAIRWHHGEYVICDLGSTNGTFVNDHRVQEQKLHSADQIRLGSHIFKFLASDHVEAQYHEAVFQMMTIDALTQTYNRRYFDDVIEREVSRSVRYARAFGLLLLDIDHFKRLNDTYGHLVGDEVLSGLCKRLAKRIRSDEVFARVGGEEFAITVVESTTDELDELGRELCSLVDETPIGTSQGNMQVTVSIGGIHFDGQHLMSTKDLFELADEQLYRAKRAGRNCYCSATTSK